METGLITALPLVMVPQYSADLPRHAQFLSSKQHIISFTRCNKKASTNSNSISNGFNKWMQGRALPEYVPHGFRRAMRDWLREVVYPKGVMDEIGEWPKSSTGEPYPQRSSLERFHRYMKHVVV